MLTHESVPITDDSTSKIAGKKIAKPKRKSALKKKAMQRDLIDVIEELEFEDEYEEVYVNDDQEEPNLFEDAV